MLNWFNQTSIAASRARSHLWILTSNGDLNVQKLASFLRGRYVDLSVSQQASLGKPSTLNSQTKNSISSKAMMTLSTGGEWFRWQGGKLEQLLKLQVVVGGGSYPLNTVWTGFCVTKLRFWRIGPGHWDPLDVGERVEDKKLKDGCCATYHLEKWDTKLGELSTLGQQQQQRRRCGRWKSVRKKEGSQQHEREIKQKLLRCSCGFQLGRLGKNRHFVFVAKRGPRLKLFFKPREIQNANLPTSDATVTNTVT